jgi:WD40 repeat protein
VPPRRLQPRVPRDLETICLKCLHKEPAGRYDSAAALADDLHRFLSGEPIVARRAGSPERVWRWCRRRPLVASLVATLALVIVTCLVLVFWKGLAEARANALAQEARQRAEAARLEAERTSARALLDGAIGQADGGDVDRALLMLAQGLELAERCGDEDLERVFRINLTGWRSRLFRLRDRLRHGDWAWDVAFSPDGRQFATASTDRKVRLWNTATGRMIGVPLSHPYPVWSVAYSPDGRTLVTGSGDSEQKKGEARLWNVATGKPLGDPFLRGDFVAMVAYSGDGRMILTGTAEQVQIWKAAGSVPIGVPMEAGQAMPALTALALHHPGGLESALLSPNGKLVLTGGRDGTARFWQTDTGEPFGPPLRHGTPDDKQGIRISAAGFSPDGELVVTGSQLIDLAARRFAGGEVRQWRVATGEQVGQPWPHRGPLKAITFSADGQRVLTGAIVVPVEPKGKLRGEARLWDVPTGKLIGPPMEHAEPVWGVAISPDSRTLLTGCEDDHIQFWSAATALPLGRAFNIDLGNALAVAFGPDGRTALAGHATGSAHVNLFEVPPGRGTALSPPHDAYVECLAFSPDGRFLLSGSNDRRARLWEVASQKPLGSAWVHESAVTQVVFSSDARLAITEDANHNRRLWDVARGQPRDSLLPLQAWTGKIAFSPDDRLAVAVYLEKGLAQLWDFADGKAHGPALQQKGARTARFSADGQTVLLGGGRTHAQSWDVATGQPLGASLQTDIPGVTVDFSPDGKRLLMIPQTRTSIGAWDLDVEAAQTWLIDRVTGALLVPPLQQRDGVMTAVFSADGKIIATGARGGSVMLWDAATGRRLGPALQHPGPVRAIAFHPDGRLLATGCDDGIMRFWDVPAPATGNSGHIRQWVQARTGNELTAEGLMPALKPEANQALRRELEAAGSEPFPPARGP